MINSNIRKKKNQRTTRLIQRLNNNIQLLSIDVIVSEKFCFRKCLFVVYSLPCMDNNSLAKQARGIAKNMPNFCRVCLCGGCCNIAICGMSLGIA